MNNRYVLDTSALLTLIEDEEGAGRVAEVLGKEEVWIPWIVPLEVYYVSLQRRDNQVAEYRYALIRSLSATLVWEASEAVLITAARFKANNRLSLADAIIAAFAAQFKATLLHKDPEYEPLAGLVNLEPLPYKPQ